MGKIFFCSTNWPIKSLDGFETISLGVDSFGQTGTIKDLFAEFAIDSESISNLGFNCS